MDNIWFKIGSVAVLVAMLVFLWPRATQMMKSSPKAGEGDWKALLIPLVLVVVFVVILILAI